MLKALLLLQASMSLHENPQTPGLAWVSEATFGPSAGHEFLLLWSFLYFSRFLHQRVLFSNSKKDFF